MRQPWRQARRDVHLDERQIRRVKAMIKQGDQITEMAAACGLSTKTFSEAAVRAGIILPRSAMSRARKD